MHKLIDVVHYDNKLPLTEGDHILILSKFTFQASAQVETSWQCNALY